ncbi:PIN domain-containing protein [Dyadobacter sp. CY323]|uniref:type II toxin-antitoxin system VapC family toxin n=1 Tax=Dyadobacter sp. CY323 TaxID=2907302 RepID=UPI001F2A6779|nr:PIN domain-containing protein [Dyadobacter sp. CY323]MCE6988015.1 PIN domain-containing protein [Dyadobacter sp. CY323]
MIYFDTDVLINLLIPQDSAKHKLAKNLYQDSTEREQFFISLLCLQETAFVLQRLGQHPDDIEAMLAAFLNFQPVPYSIMEMERAIYLAKRIGFQNINDCLHTAIAETHCSKLLTFNKADFKRIGNLANIEITLLQ